MLDVVALEGPCPGADPNGPPHPAATEQLAGCRIIGRWIGWTWHLDGIGTRRIEARSSNVVWWLSPQSPISVALRQDYDVLLREPSQRFPYSPELTIRYSFARND